MQHIQLYSIFEGKNMEVMNELQEAMTNTPEGIDLSAITDWEIKRSGVLHIKGKNIPLSRTRIEKSENGWVSYIISSGQKISEEFSTTLSECIRKLWASIISKNIPVILLPKKDSRFVASNIKAGLGMSMKEIIEYVESNTKKQEIGGDPILLDKYIRRLNELIKIYDFSDECVIEYGVVIIRKILPPGVRGKVTPGMKGNRNNSTLKQAKSIWEAFVINKIPQYFITKNTMISRRDLYLNPERLNPLNNYIEKLSELIKSNIITIDTPNDEILDHIFKYRIPNKPYLIPVKGLEKYMFDLDHNKINQTLEKILTFKENIELFNSILGVLSIQKRDYKNFFNFDYFVRFITPDYIFGSNNSGNPIPILDNFDQAMDLSIDNSISYEKNNIKKIVTSFVGTNLKSNIDYDAIFESIFNDGNLGGAMKILSKYIGNDFLRLKEILPGIPKKDRQEFTNTIIKNGFSKEDIESYFQAQDFGLF